MVIFYSGGEKMLKILNSDLELQAYINPIEALIEEQINRGFTFSFTSLLDDKSEYITHNNIIEIEDNYFNIVYFKKNRKNSLMIEANCEHVSYDLNKEEYDKEFFTEDGTPSYILGKILEGTGFTIGTVEFTNVETFSIQEPLSRRAILILFAEYLGGELLFEKYTISILIRRGADNGVQFRVGKNIKGISKEVDNRKPIGGLPKIAYDVDVIELSSLEEYGDLEKVNLGDTVKVFAADLGIEVDQRIVSYGYNPIKKINSNVEIANFIDDLSDTIFKIKRTTIIKEALYNGIRIGPENGFEAIRSDKKARTVMNATEGIKIQKGDGTGNVWNNVIYLDINGNAVFEGTVQASDFVGGTINIGTGAFTVDNTGNVTITTGSINLGSGAFTVDNLGNIAITTGSINLGSGVFTVDNAGNMTATNGYFEGTIEATDIIGSTITGGTITGTLVQTQSSGNYPRAFLSVTDNYFGVQINSFDHIQIRPLVGLPTLRFSTELYITSLVQSDDIFQISTNGSINIQAAQGVFINGVQVGG